ncbi:MAG: hypothetical protein M1401_07295 [Chloroflexi bacterium]|nr:hypothetical protein [Chloroflexota bacterium]
MGTIYEISALTLQCANPFAVAAPQTSGADDARSVTRAPAGLLNLLALAAASLALYGGFFSSLDFLWPIYTSQTALGGMAVVASALTFCLVYGSFARQLLETLGIRAPK